MSASTLPQVLASSLGCQYNGLEVTLPSLLDRLLEGSWSLHENRPSKKQEEKEYICVGLAFLTQIMITATTNVVSHTRNKLKILQSTAPIKTWIDHILK